MGGRGWGPFRLETDKIVRRVHRFKIAARVAELQASAWTNGKGQKRTCHNLFSRCHEALTFVTFAELQAQNCTSHISVCFDFGWRSTGSLHWPANQDANGDTAHAQWSALSRETQSSETFVSNECRLVMYVVDLLRTHVYTWMWFVVINLGERDRDITGAGAKLNRLRLETNYKLMIWSLRNLMHRYSKIPGLNSKCVHCQLRVKTFSFQSKMLEAAHFSIDLFLH